MKTRKSSSLKIIAFYSLLGLTALYFYTRNTHKMEKNENPKQSTLDKVIFGLLIGGAIGSVLGLTVAPEKGKNVRTQLKDKGTRLAQKHDDAIDVVAKKSKKFLSFVTDLVLGKGEKKKSDIMSWLDEMNEIPSESEEIKR